MVQFEQHQLSVVCVTHSHSNNIPQLVSPCLSVWVLCWLSPHTLAVSPVAQSGFVFAQQPSTEYNPGHFLQHQEPVPLENSLKCIMTFNIFTPSFLSLHASGLGGVEEPRCPMLPLEHAFCWGCSEPQLPPPVSSHWHCRTSISLQAAELTKSVGWDFHEWRVVMQVRRILTAEENACGSYGACLDWYLRLKRFFPSHYYYNYYYIQLVSAHGHSGIIPSCQNPLKMMQLTHEGPDEAWLDLAEECELLIWSSVSFSFGNCKKTQNQNQTTTGLRG